MSMIMTVGQTLTGEAAAGPGVERGALLGTQVH